MTDQQKMQINRLRSEGHGYGCIAALLGLSENTVKSHCRRNGLAGKLGSIIRESGGPVHLCPQCGLPVRQTPGRKEKKFCSDKCRNAWWSAHADKVQRKAYYDFECAHCHKPFRSYGNNHRKYCSTECYMLERFGRCRA